MTAGKKLEEDFAWFCRRRFLFKGQKYEPRAKIVEGAIQESFKACGEVFNVEACHCWSTRFSRKQCSLASPAASAAT